jgi:hypothetical protein
VVLAGGLIPGEAFPHHLRRSQFEAVEIAHVVSVVVSERLFIEVPEQVEGLDRNIGTADAALQERPKVLDGVGVYVAVHVGHGVIYHFVRVVALQSVIRQKEISIERGTGFDVLADFRLKGFSFCDLAPPQYAPCRRVQRCRALRSCPYLRFR